MQNEKCRMKKGRQTQDRAISTPGEDGVRNEGCPGRWQNGGVNIVNSGCLRVESCGIRDPGPAVLALRVRAARQALGFRNAASPATINSHRFPSNPSFFGSKKILCRRPYRAGGASRTGRRSRLRQGYGAAGRGECPAGQSATTQCPYHLFRRVWKKQRSTAINSEKQPSARCTGSLRTAINARVDTVIARSNPPGTGFWIEGNPRLRHDARSNFRSLELF
jgi:hypothetical protein